MSEMGDRSPEEFRLELAMHMPAHGESFGEWARSNPESEYALWMAIRHPEEKIEDKMHQRVRSAERAPKWAIARAGLLATIGASMEAMTAVYTVKGEMSIGNTILVGVLALLPLSDARQVIKNQLPKARAYAKQERDLFERGMKARNAAKRLLASKNN